MANVLIVDDDPAVLKCVRMVVSSQGHSVRALHDSVLASDLISQQEPFDLLITDICMPGLNGIELIERALAIRPTLPVLVVSAYLDEETLKALRELGCRAYLNKPYRMQDLITAMDFLLGSASSSSA